MFAGVLEVENWIMKKKNSSAESPIQTLGKNMYYFIYQHKFNKLHVQVLTNLR